MILDGIIGIIIIAEMTRGKIKGFADTLIRLILVGFAVVLGSLLTGNFNKLMAILHIDKLINARILTTIRVGKVDFDVVIPDAVKNFINDLGSEHSTLVINRLTGATSSVISFSIIFLIVWIFTTWLRRKFAKARSHGTIIGTVDGLAGMVFGLAKGAIIVFIVLALMFPTAELFAPKLSNILIDQLNDSIFSLWLYDNNPLFAFMDKIKL